MQTWAILGTDTGVGKTYFSSLFIKKWVSLNQRCCPFKPVSTGAARDAVHEDLALLMEEANMLCHVNDMNPVSWPAPLSPNIAAEEVGGVFQMSKVLDAYRNLTSLKPDHVVMEGVGGVMVPLSASETYLDLLDQIPARIILVVGLRLGSLNHALLSIEALRQKGHEVEWVANFLTPQYKARHKHIDYLSKMIGKPPMAVVPYAVSDPASVIWSRPFSLDWYNASSARLTQDSTESLP